MKEGYFSRTEMLIGKEGLEKLRAAKVALFGVGGVGGYAAEALARSGIGGIDIVDGDKISESNLNRQIIALRSTVGKSKVEVCAARLRDINPDCEVTPIEHFYTPEDKGRIDFAKYDYVIDAVDTVTAKISIIAEAKAAGTPVISCMGTGNKLDPAGFKVADISKTETCPLARVMRRELKKRGIDKVKVVFSTEPPVKPDAGESEKAASGKREKDVPGSISFVPPAAGFLIAGEVIKDLIK